MKKVEKIAAVLGGITAVVIPAYMLHKRGMLNLPTISLGSGPLIEDPALMALSGLGNIGQSTTAWRPYVEELRNGVWTRTWTGNYNYISSEDAINFVKTTFGQPPSAAMYNDKAAYRIAAEQMPTTATEPTKPDTVVEEHKTAYEKTVEIQPKITPKTEETSTSTTVPPSNPPVTTNTAQTGLQVPDTTDYEIKTTESNIMSSFNNLDIKVKIGIAAGIVGAIGGAALLLKKKK